MSFALKRARITPDDFASEVIVKRYQYENEAFAGQLY
jgi:hypothetical protein